MCYEKNEQVRIEMYQLRDKLTASAPQNEHDAVSYEIAATISMI